MRRRVGSVADGTTRPVWSASNRRTIRASAIAPTLADGPATGSVRPGSNICGALRLAAALSGPVRAPDRCLTTNSPPTRTRPSECRSLEVPPGVIRQHDRQHEDGDPQRLGDPPRQAWPQPIRPPPPTLLARDDLVASLTVLPVPVAVFVAHRTNLHKWDTNAT